MRIIGLTGSIACGKSTVSAWLRKQPGCAVIDGDLLSRELTAAGGPALPLIRARFGDQFFSPGGTLERKKLGALIFSDPSARSQLDQLMAPLLQQLTKERINQASEAGFSLCFLDFPLLFEKNYDKLCDTVWCVFLSESVQLERLMLRDGLSEQQARLRIRSSLSSEEKAARSQVVIDNSGDVSFTLSLLPPLLQQEFALAGRTRRRSQKYYESSPATDASGPTETSVAASSLSSPGSRPAEDSSSAVSPLSPAASFVMERPAAAHRRKEAAKAPWLLPSWLIALLTTAFFLSLACFAGLSMMQAYLTRQAEKHLREEWAIHNNYPISYRSLIEEWAASYNLNPAFVTAIIRNESSFQPTVESGVGARGLMQLMPDTAEWIAGKLKTSGYSFERMYDPGSNIQFGCWYLNYLAGLFHGDPVCVACAYHAGQGQVTAWLSDARFSRDGIKLDLASMPDGPTKNYAGKVIKAYGIYQSLYFTQNIPADPVSSSAASSSGFRQ